MRLSEAINYFIDSKEAAGRSPLTLLDYRRTLDAFSEHVNDPEAASLTVYQVREFIAAIRQRNVQDVTVSKHVRNLRAFLRWLWRDGIHPENIALRIEPVKFRVKRMSTISDEDFRKLLDSCNRQTMLGRRDYAILCFLYDTGVRVSELCDLRVEDTDIKGRMAKVLGKGNKERMVFFSAATAAAMTSYRYRLKWPLKESPWFFVSWDGKMRPNGVFQMLKRLKDKTGVTSPVNPHAFRHTFATNYLRLGGDINSLQRLLGHSSLAIVSRYLNLQTEDLKSKHQQFSPMAALTRRS